MSSPQHTTPKERVRFHVFLVLLFLHLVDPTPNKTETFAPSRLFLSMAHRRTIPNNLLPKRNAINPTMTKRRVCLFGLSADPPTGNAGHVGIARKLASLPAFDEIRVLPVYRHTYAVCTSRVELCSCCCCCCVLSNILCLFLTLFSFVQSKRMRLATYEDRMAMCRLAFEGLPHTTVTNDEYLSWCRKVEGM